MQDSVQTLFNQAGQNLVLIAALAVITVILLVLVVWQMPPVQAYLKKRCVLRKIEKSGYDVQHHIVIPDGLGGDIYIEHLVLSERGFIIYEVMNYKGVIFAADTIDIWTQVVGKRSYKFHNPLPELESKIMAVRALLPTGMPVEGYLLVADNVQFPKGRPDKLIFLSRLDETAVAKGARLENTQMLENWQKIRSVARQVDPDKYH